LTDPLRSHLAQEQVALLENMKLIFVLQVFGAVGMAYFADVCVQGRGRKLDLRREELPDIEGATVRKSGASSMHAG
jgi:hypothetical protein